jgi:hypothetical protein
MNARKQLLNSKRGEQSAPLSEATRQGAAAVSVPVQLPRVESQQSTRLRSFIEEPRGPLQPIEVSGSREIPRPILSEDAQPELQNIRSFIRPGAALSSSSFLQPIDIPRPISSMSSSEVPRRLHVTATRSYLQPAAASAAPAQVRQQVTQQVSKGVVSAAQSVDTETLKQIKQIQTKILDIQSNIQRLQAERGPYSKSAAQLEQDANAEQTSKRQNWNSSHQTVPILWFKPGMFGKGKIEPYFFYFGTKSFAWGSSWEKAVQRATKLDSDQKGDKESGLYASATVTSNSSQCQSVSNTKPCVTVEVARESNNTFNFVFSSDQERNTFVECMMQPGGVLTKYTTGMQTQIHRLDDEIRRLEGELREQQGQQKLLETQIQQAKASSSSIQVDISNKPDLIQAIDAFSGMMADDLIGNATTKYPSQDVETALKNLIDSWSTDEELYNKCCKQTTYTYLSEQLAPLLFKALNIPSNSEAYNQTLLPMIFKAIFSGLKTLYLAPSSAAAAAAAPVVTQSVVSQAAAAAAAPAATQSIVSESQPLSPPISDQQTTSLTIPETIMSAQERRSIAVEPPLYVELSPVRELNFSTPQPLPLRPPESSVSSSRLQSEISSSSLFKPQTTTPRLSSFVEREGQGQGQGLSLAQMRRQAIARSSGRTKPAVSSALESSAALQQQQNQNAAREVQPQAPLFQQQQQQQQQEAAAAAEETAAATQPPEEAAQQQQGTLRRIGNALYNIPGVSALGSGASALGSGFGRLFGYGRQEEGGNRKRTRRYKKMNALTKKRIQKYKKKYTRVKRHHSRRK